MEIGKFYKKYFTLITVVMFLAVIGGSIYAGQIAVEHYAEGRTFAEIMVYTAEHTEQAIAGMLVGALIGVYVASVLLPLIANKTALLEENADLDSGEQDLVGTWTLFIILGVMGAIIGMAF